MEFWFCLVFVLCAVVTCSTSLETISANQTIQNGETIVSAQGTFQLGFFSPPNSSNSYVGIWFNRISSGTVMWVANRNTPLANTTGDLSLTPQGILIIRNAKADIIWSSANLSASPLERNPVGKLLDNGNFVITDGNSNNLIWQSFDFPTDTFMPGMKLGKDLVSGIERHLTSWKTESDPSPGEHTVWLDTQGYLQIVVRQGSDIKFRPGPWNGVRFSGAPNLGPNLIYTYGFVLDRREMYYYFNLVNSSVFTRMVITPGGSYERLVWIDSTQKWSLYAASQIDSCDQYAVCGTFASCSINNSPTCGCLKGFEPKSPDQWNVADWSQGCRRSTSLNCGSEEGFRRYSSIKLPDTQRSWFDQTMSLDECKTVCKRNCSCSAYTTQNISGRGSGCLLWFSDLTDIRTFSENGQDLYIRMSASELAKDKGSSVNERVKIKIILPIISVSILLVIILSVYVIYQCKRKKPSQGGTLEEDHGHDTDYENSKYELELPLIDFSSLREATNNFSDKNKLGEGGFGPVFKGVMEDGKEVAVKRLSRTSTQGIEEFKNEVITISKLQHRNLVRLLGCCIMGSEKMLVYEYMPNKGLHSFIFDENKSKLLDWPTRFHIIKGIARGLLYLHQDSRLRIIHRDLKVSNILLDHDMIPKISDFGMARSFGGNQIEANTNRVVGTYGYMAPEYAGDGIFSVKSDVFSFGVLVLEIVSGKRNRGFFHTQHSNNLIGHAWGLHKESRSLELVAASLTESITLSQVLRSIHVGLLCVQQRPEDRPTMSSVVLMLESEGELPPPKPQGFFYQKTAADSCTSSSTYNMDSVNQLTVTMLDSR